MESEFKQRLRRSTDHAQQTIKNEFQRSQFQLGTHNRHRLSQALANEGCGHLAKVTLLDEKIHKQHAADLTRKFHRHYVALLARNKKLKEKTKAARYFDISATDIATNSLRFLTLLDSVEVVDHDSIIKAVETMRADITAAIKSVRGMRCLGAIEVEVISIPLMQRMRELSQALVEQRKIDVCEDLAHHLNSSLFATEKSFVLIHFHGVLSSHKSRNFEKLRLALAAVKRWAIAPRQIEIKKLSEGYSGKPKSTEANLQDIAAYIVKGGNDWRDGKSYLRYKMNFSSDMNLSMEEWEALNWRKDEDVQREHRMEGITDLLSLTPGEIVVLARVIHTMMTGNQKNTGYLIQVGRW